MDVIRSEVFFFSSRRRHTRYWRDWSSDVCSSDLQCGRSVSPQVRIDLPFSRTRPEGAMDLYLVRHGESEIPHDSVQSNYPLSTLGKEQAGRLGGRLRGLTVDHLITTPFRRNPETAAANPEATGVAIAEEPGVGALT